MSYAVAALRMAPQVATGIEEVVELSEPGGARISPPEAALGFGKALARWQAAQKGMDEVEAYLALFEALNWAHALDDQIARRWRPLGHNERSWWGWRDHAAGPMFAETMEGLRYVRNRVHHQLADALEVVHGRRYPRTYQVRFQTFIWREADELPLGDRTEPASLRQAYTRALEGSPVDLALGMMVEPLTLVALQLRDHSSA